MVSLVLRQVLSRHSSEEGLEGGVGAGVGAGGGKGVDGEVDDAVFADGFFAGGAAFVATAAGVEVAEEGIGLKDLGRGPDVDDAVEVLEADGAEGLGRAVDDERAAAVGGLVGHG